MAAQGVVTVLLAFDAGLAKGVNSLVRNSAFARSMAVVAATGLAGVEVLLMGALVVAGQRRSVARMLAGVGLVYAGSEVLGAIWQRQRPFAMDSEIEALVPHPFQRSFPSRHVASGLAMASIGGRAHPILGLAMSAAAWSLGLSRVAVGLHYPTDVLAGAVLGALVGRLLGE